MNNNLSFKSFSQTAINSGKYSLPEFISDLNILYPFDSAEKWDNVGLLLSGYATSVIPDQNLFFSLDVTLDVIENLSQGDILVSHHPIIFSGIKNLEPSKPNFEILREAIKKDLTLIALHTNYDKHFLNEFYLTKILDLPLTHKQDGLVIHEFESSINFNSIKNKVMEILPFSHPLTFVKSSDNSIRKIAVCTGSGGSLLSSAKKLGVDLLLTGDITYHSALDAKSFGISMIDITHFHSEKYFGIDLLEIFELNNSHIIEQFSPFSYEVFSD